MFYILLAAYVATTSAGLIALKLGSTNGALLEMANNKIALNITILSMLGVFLYGLSFILYMYLISKNDLGYIIPLTTALVYIIIFVASFFIFKESFTVFKVLGIALIVMGLAFLNIRS